MSELDAVLGWVAQGRQRVDDAVAALAPADVGAPSALPGWTRGHVITHLARNADALVNLLDWARTGVETPMYSSASQRDSDIEAGAGRPLPEQLADLQSAGERFAHAAASLPADAWAARVRSAQGRDIPASEVPWLRARELWIHLVDLNVGVDVDVWPDGLAVRLLHEVAASMSLRIDRAVDLRPDGMDAVRLGPTDTDAAAVVSGSPARIAGWLVGRVAVDALATHGEPPELPNWL